MSHPDIDNQSPYAFEPLFLADEEMRPLFVPVIKGTFKIHPTDEHLTIADEQAAVDAAGEMWGDPDTSSYKYEPECALEKLATDVVLIGSAHPPQANMTRMDVGFWAGPLQKIARVFGDRVWRRKLGVKYKSRPELIEEPIPLIAERAFGGWDRTHPNPKKHRFEPRNPMGTSYRRGRGKFEAELKLPNIENPARLLRGFRDVVGPTLFGFTSPNWQPRCRFAGTYDKKWEKNRKPLLPKDFDRRFFNAAPTDLIAKGFLKGNEPIIVVNASPRPKVTFHLPGLPPPELRVELAWGEDRELKTRLDTVIVNTDEDRVFLIWRANMVLRQGPLDLRTIEVRPVASGVKLPVRRT